MSTMQNLLNGLKNPIVVFCLVVISLSFWKKSSDGGLKHAITSDSRGYYAYLPAFFIYNDATFEQAHKAEYTYDSNRRQQNHFHITEDGKIYNKYFPGVAVMQLPFFGLAALTTYLIGDPITGYSDLFSVFYILGSYFYFILGVYFFTKVVRRLYPDLNNIKWFIPLVYLASPLIYFGLFSMLSHHYSFALFGVFFWLVLKIQEQRSLKLIFYLGFVLGLIFLIRPTNVSVVLAIPFFLRDKSSATELFLWLFKEKAKPLFFAIFGFSLGAFILLLTWKWESGKWLFWAYSGEGFNWDSPMIWQVLFSFRVGLFVHTPLIFISFIAAIWYFRNKSFQFIFWWLYFLFNLYVISSWWCWDYESPFGMRPFTEHWFVLIMPLFMLASQKRTFILICMIGLASLGFLRVYQQVEGQYFDQRFTASSYFKSLAFWRDYNYQRWNFSRTCLPFGEFQNSWTMIDSAKVNSVESEFSYTTELKLNPGRTNSRLYCKLSVDKKIVENDWSGIYVVYDAYSKDGVKRYYRAQELYFDKLEGRNEWCHYDSEEIIPDNFDDYDYLKVYIWNDSDKIFDVKNVKVVLEEYRRD